MAPATGPFFYGNVAAIGSQCAHQARAPHPQPDLEGANRIATLIATTTPWQHTRPPAQRQALQTPEPPRREAPAAERATTARPLRPPHADPAAAGRGRSKATTGCPRQPAAVRFQRGGPLKREPSCASAPQAWRPGRLRRPGPSAGIASGLLHQTAPPPAGTGRTARLRPGRASLPAPSANHRPGQGPPSRDEPLHIQESGRRCATAPRQRPSPCRSGRRGSSGISRQPTARRPPLRVPSRRIEAALRLVRRPGRTERDACGDHL